MNRIEVPAGLLAQASRGEAWAGWLDRLPRLAAELLDEWELVVDDTSRHGFCSLVLPVRTASGRPAVLKVHTDVDAEESDHEHLALQHWHGQGAVQLLRADPHRRAMLLERLHPEDLTGLWDLEACEIVAGLYGRIHVPAPPPLRTLSSYVERWNADLEQLPREAPLPRRMVEQAVSLSTALIADDATDGTMIHGDLHYENVLAADREPWLVIDPKPVSGDPHYELAPMLWNRFDELAGDVRDGLRRRFHTLVDGAGLDEDRARDWVVVRMVHNAMWTVHDAVGRDLTSDERTWMTVCVTIAKAVQE
ncbi:aminoglycoside phosphotransferase family protein [Nocardioides jensenii]|uniref:aminoglycoside phosphotransferase family protein n=1 Tax=Nocardioides jensenii TaxID=1843 RepID=UPI00082F50E3|nr:aminoglycoside phosphotransferase family protein [Nocardioides jensenii]